MSYGPSAQIYPISTTSANGLLGAITLSVKEFRNVQFQLYTATLSDYTLKFVMSMQEAAPDFTAASSGTNLWSYVQEVNLATGNFIPGATGIVVVGESTIAGEINANATGAIWIGILLSSYSAGSVRGVYSLSTNA